MAKIKPIQVINEIIQWVEAIAIAIVISFLIRGFVFETVIVEGPSMENTLATEDRLILYKLGYYFSMPRRGDIVVLEVHEGVLNSIPFIKRLPIVKNAIPDLTEIDYIKRVIAVPGDKLEFKDGSVYVNGQKLKEDYAKGITHGPSGIIEVENNKVFVMGDNRLDSRDSREIGQISCDRIRGKAVFRIWPFKRIGSIYKKH